MNKTLEQNQQKLRWSIIIPVLLLVLIIAILVGMGGDVYVNTIRDFYKIFIKQVGWTFGPMTILFIAVLLYCMFSRVGNVRIGGENAEKILQPMSYFGITITGITGTGLLFYGATEPIFHFMNPPAHVGLVAGATTTAVYSMGQTFMHWGISMFSIYAILGLACALFVYNLGYNFSASSMLRPFLGRWVNGIGGTIIDLTLIFAMVLGNVWMMGQSLLSVSSGLNALFGIERNGMLYLAITSFVLICSLGSIKSGIQNAVKGIANLNMVFLYALLVFFVIFGPLGFSFALSMEGLAYYFDNFFSLTFANGIVDGNTWPSMWTIAFYGSWAASGPIMALFLGKVARGYTVRQFLYSIFLGGALFYLIWFAIFGGTGIFAEMTYKDIYSVIKVDGFESGIYVLFNHYPISIVTSAVYMIVSLLAVITTLTAKLDGMTSMCLTNVNAENMETPFSIKFAWGIYAGFMGWACATFLGFDGVRMFAGFAGIFGMSVALLASISILWVVRHVEHRPDGTSILTPDHFKYCLVDLWLENRRQKKAQKSA